MCASTLARLLAATIVFAGGIARAQSDADREEARRHYQLAIEHQRHERYPQAVQEFRRARDLLPTPSAHFNLGRAYAAVGRNREAITSLRAFLEGPHDGSTLDRAAAAEARRRVDDLERTLAHWSLEITPPTAAVTLDGVPVPDNDHPHEADPGEHTLEARAPGHETVLRRMNFVAGLYETFRIELPRVESSGRVRVIATPRQANIRVDGRLVGHGAVEEPLHVGRHVIEVDSPGYSTFSRELEVRRSQTTTVQASLSDHRPLTSRPWFWVIVGVVLSGAIAGSVVLASEPRPATPTALGTFSNAVVVW